MNVFIIGLIAIGVIALIGWVISRLTIVEITPADLTVQERSLIEAELHLADLDFACALAQENSGEVPAELAERKSAAEINVALAQGALADTHRKPVSQPTSTPVAAPGRRRSPLSLPQLPAQALLRPMKDEGEK
jgi:hypothetical protein